MNTSELSPPAPAPAPRCRNPLLRFVTSIWLGIGAMTAILLYSAVISASAPTRAALEMTDMEAFRHWFFVALCVLFVFSLTAVTFFRTRWLAINAGAVVTHIGLLLLIIGAMVYFGTKVEGDVLLQCPAIEIQADVGAQTPIVRRFPARQGETFTALQADGRPLTLMVSETYAAGLQPVAAARLHVHAADATREVLLNAAEPNGQIIAPGLTTRLIVYPPETSFYDQELRALYLRPADGGGDEIILPLDRLPRYHPRFPAEAGPVQNSAGAAVASRSMQSSFLAHWRLPIEIRDPNLPLDIDVLGYLPYVVDQRPIAGPDGRPRVLPIAATPEQRRGASPAVYVRVRGRGPHAEWTDTRWLLFTQYPGFENPTLPLRLPDGTAWRITFSRQRHKLDAALAAHSLTLKYFPGRRGIESYRSDILYRPLSDAQGPARAGVVQTNETLTIGRWTLYQSSYDSDQHWRYTILGVGNRYGILPMNLGWMIVTVGCIYAFYVKPVLLRRARARRRDPAP